MDFDQESEEIKRLIEQSRNSDGDEDYKRRVRMGGDLLSLLNNPSAAEINSGVKLAKPDYQGQAENVIKGIENPLEKAAKIASTLSAYQGAQKAQAEAERLRSETILGKSKFSPAEVAKLNRATGLDYSGLTRGEAAAKKYPTLEDAVRIGEAKVAKDNTFDEKKASRINKETERLADTLSGGQKIASSINVIDDMFGKIMPGMSLDKLQVVNGKLLNDGKEVDLPGVSIPGLGRVSAHSSDARMLNSQMAAIFNTELKDRSGTAVTDNELDRIKTEFASGKYNTEAEMIQALKNYKARAVFLLKNREAAYDPEAVAEYKSRGGKTSDDLFQSGKAVEQPPAPPPREFTNQKTGEVVRIHADGTKEIIKAGRNATP